MRSWNLDKFVKEHGWYKVHQIWGASRQAINKAIKNKRSIQVIELDTGFEVRESKLLASAPVGIVNLDQRRPTSGRLAKVLED